MNAELVIGLLAIFIVCLVAIFMFWIISVQDIVKDVRDEVDVVKQVSLKKKMILSRLVIGSNLIN